MTRNFLVALLLVASCATPTEHQRIGERLSFWQSDVRRFIHMHGSEFELRQWLNRRGLEFSNLTEGPMFVALLETIREPGDACPTDIFLVGAINDATVAWYRVEAKQQPDCDDSLAT